MDSSEHQLSGATFLATTRYYGSLSTSEHHIVKLKRGNTSLRGDFKKDGSLMVRINMEDLKTL